MEWWKNGILGRKSINAGGLIPDMCNYYKNRSHSAKPNIPLFHYSMAFDYGKPADGVTDLAQNTKISIVT